MREREGERVKDKTRKKKDLVRHRYGDTYINMDRGLKKIYQVFWYSEKEGERQIEGERVSEGERENKRGLTKMK